MRDCVALGMEVFCVHATFLDFGDNLRCMKQVAGLAGAPRNLLICRLTSCAMQPRRQSLLGHGLARYTTQAMQPRRQSPLGHGLSPYKKTISHCFLRERAPDEICFYLFCMACSFREKSSCIMEKGMVD